MIKEYNVKEVIGKQEFMEWRPEFRVRFLEERQQDIFGIPRENLGESRRNTSNNDISHNPVVRDSEHRMQEIMRLLSAKIISQEAAMFMIEGITRYDTGGVTVRVD